MMTFMDHLQFHPAESVWCALCTVPLFIAGSGKFPAVLDANARAKLSQHIALSIQEIKLCRNASEGSARFTKLYATNYYLQYKKLGTNSRPEYHFTLSIFCELQHSGSGHRKIQIAFSDCSTHLIVEQA